MEEKITLAIYDENKLQKELLHHQLERIRIDVLYSTAKLQELKQYFEQRPADILLVNGAHNLSKLVSIIKNLRKRKGKLKVIIYNMDADETLVTDMRGIRDTELFFTSGGWANLLNTIEGFNKQEIIPDRKEIKLPAHLLKDNPFSKISGNEKYVDILRYLKEGKSNRQIAYLLSTSINNVKYHIKKMHDETGSNTTKMVADAIKAGLI